ncbi:MAG TPA: molybdopterin cofactor-binding domain-containing protein, partial [Candidatus Elarobacter sp.]|nr:molybdopterin cofactor-binding domain-containing protein [Candidatus Elarobacter sp.]
MIVDRASFLAGSAGLVVSFALGAPVSAQQQQSAPGSGQREAQTRGANQYPDLESWLAIDRSGDVTVFFGKAELGTGTETALMQLVADDLDVPFARVHVVQPDTTRTPDQGYTAGSQTLTSGALPVRQAAVTARRMLLELASTHLRAPVDALEARAGSVSVRG